MNQYDTLYTFRILHPYFDDETCSVIRLQPERETLRTFANYRCLFKQTAVNEWHIIGEIPATAHDWPHCQQSLHFTATIHDPDFLWYTSSLLPYGIQGENIRCQPGKDSLKTFQIQLHPDAVPLPALECPRCYSLSYRETQPYWEYLLIPRHKTEEELSLLLTEAAGKIVFDDPVATTWNGARAYLTRSVAPVPLRARYPFQLQLYEKKRFGPGGGDRMRRMLCKQVALPTPGRFIPRASDTIQHILYF